VTNSVYQDPRWRKVRRLVLERDGHQCQLRLDGCTGKATQVDHTIDLGDGGAPYDPANLASACKPCNIAKRNIGVAARAREARSGRRYELTWEELNAKYSSFDW
jgi:5-methylcytosine-specific restriction protein A